MQSLAFSGVFCWILISQQILVLNQQCITDRAVYKGGLAMDQLCYSMEKDRQLNRQLTASSIKICMCIEFTYSNTRNLLPCVNLPQISCQICSLVIHKLHKKKDSCQSLELFKERWYTLYVYVYIINMIIGMVKVSDNFKTAVKASSDG